MLVGEQQALRTDLLNGVAAQQSHVAMNFVAIVLQRARCTRLTTGGDAVERRATDHHSVGAKRQRGRTGGYFFAPAGHAAELSAPRVGTRVMLFQKRYVPLPNVEPPPAIVGNSHDVEGAPFLGDPAANLQVLLPDTPSFDLAVNVFAYQPGGHLPFVEIHIMEHGLVMLDGAGVYRLEDDWYPVRGGDVIWMGPYCPQWFVAMGKEPARYLYYKDVNRAAL
jgi:(S)-ureidoglycine aminohydrolase